jgi:predicted membrane metal-binding protein
MTTEQRGYHQVEKGSERNFGIVVAGFFALVGGLPLLVHGKEPRWWAFLLAAAFATIALLAPQSLAPLNRLWFKLGLILGKIVSPIVMGLVFFCGVTPFAVLARFVGKDFLSIERAARARQTHWVERPKNSGYQSTMSDQF